MKKGTYFEIQKLGGGLKCDGAYFPKYRVYFYYVYILSFPLQYNLTLFFNIHFNFIFLYFNLYYSPIIINILFKKINFYFFIN